MRTLGPARLKRSLDRRIEMMTAGRLHPRGDRGMEGLGFHITHVYGLTEVYGPAVVCAWRGEWDDLPPAERRGSSTPGRHLPGAR